MIIDHTEKYVNNSGYSDFVFKVYTRNPAAFVHHIAGVEIEKLNDLSNGEMLNIIVNKEKEMSESEQQAFITWNC
jgi:acyl-ACP thioesterase